MQIRRPFDMAGSAVRPEELRYNCRKQITLLFLWLGISIAIRPARLTRTFTGDNPPRRLDFIIITIHAHTYCVRSDNFIYDSKLKTNRTLHVVFFTLNCFIKRNYRRNNVSPDRYRSKLFSVQTISRVQIPQEYRSKTGAI